MSDLTPDPEHGNSGGGGSRFPDPTIPQALAESEQPEVRQVRTDRSDIEHPPWCDVEFCPVRIDAGTPFGSHRSRAVILPGRVEVKLSLWALHGTEPLVAVDVIDEVLRDGLAGVEVPVPTEEPLNLGELLGETGVVLDLIEARTIARVLVELARQAEGSS